MPNDTDAQSDSVEVRIQNLVLIAGAGITLAAGIGWGLKAAVGAAIGTGLCWLNFRWLRQGAEGVIRLGMAQAGIQNVRVPKTTHAKFLGRLALLALCVYAILAWLHLPVVAVFCGLTAVFPAIVIELGYEMARGHHRWNAQ
ncbi:MAG TPA: ATP synthase subunit I [Bryobacteraceae bacterium]|nr:ATP synthase subunit I [Bryobacteraceae bacterium]